MSWNFLNPPVDQYVYPYRNTNWLGDYPAEHLFHIWHEGEQVVIDLSRTPPRYKLVDYRGNILLDQAGTSNILNLGVLPIGYYRLLFYEPGVNIPTFEESRGELNISIWRDTGTLVSRPMTMPSLRINGYIPQLWACLSASSLRFPIDNAVNPNEVGGIRLSDAQNDDTVWRNSLNQVADDPHRTPLETVIHFRAGIGQYAPDFTYTARVGYEAGIAQVVNTFGTNRYWYECLNEPDIAFGAWRASEFIKELSDFHGAVKAANPNAKVLGPNPVNITSQLPWFRELLELGGGNYLDGISFHNYNGVEGDLEMSRKVAEDLIALLTEYGQQNKPLFMTEWGTFAATNGSFTPMRQLRKTLMAMLFWEQYGLPKERFIIFYGSSHGFWDFSSFYMSDKMGSYSTCTAIRVLSEEVYGKPFASRYYFGDEDNDFLGSLYQNPSDGSGVAVFMAGERIGDPMTFRVAGASSLVTVDAMGHTSTIQVVQGRITLALIGEPVYIRLPAGVTLTPEPRVLGRNLALVGNRAISSASTGNPDGRYVALDEITSPYQTDAPIPITVGVTLGQPTTFDTIYIKGMMPWQIRGSILEATVEIYENNSWVQVGAIANSYTWMKHISSKWDAGCWSETYFNERWSWLIDIGRQVRSTQIRLIVTKTTYGGEVEEINEAVTHDGQGNATQILSLQGIAVYNSAQSRQPEVLRQG